ncbi:hypothetical protein JSO59_000835 [Riemerella anatipestifer]|uniref:hypothetical protein n=1 Tax=Riemerella anatipestifer TaxID=34085 RepID=UPI0030C0B0D0
MNIELKMRQNNSFQESFLQTKVAWKKDLIPVKVDWFSLKKVPKIEADCIRSSFRNILNKSILISIISTPLALIFPEQVWVLIPLCFLGIFCFYSYAIIYKRIKFSNYILLRFHPLIIRCWIASLIIIPLLRGLGYLYPKYEEVLKYGSMCFFCVLAIALQYFLLYYHTKRRNVLISK